MGKGPAEWGKSVPNSQVNDASISTNEKDLEARSQGQENGLHSTHSIWFDYLWNGEFALMLASRVDVSR